MVKRMPRRRTGFSLLEMLAVAIVIGILALIAIPAIINARETSARSTCNANRKQILSAIATYKARTGASITSQTELNSAVSNLVANGYLTPAPTDPTSGLNYLSNIVFNLVNDGVNTNQPPAAKITVQCPNTGSIPNHGEDSILL